MGALQLVWNSGPLGTADSAKAFFFFSVLLVNKVAFSSLLIFLYFLPFFYPHADFSFYFLLSQVFHVT